MPGQSSNLTASSSFPPFLNASTKTPSFYDMEQENFDLHLQVSRILQEQRFRKVKTSYRSLCSFYETGILSYDFVGIAEVGNSFGNLTRPSAVPGRRIHSEERRRLSVKRSIRELLQIAGEGNWDNDGALAIVPETVKIAETLVDLFPEFVFTAPPDVSPTPHGEVDFDWVISRNIMLTVSVCPSEEIAVAGIFGDSDYHKTERWTGDLPSSVRKCFDRLRESAGWKDRNS